MEAFLTPDLFLSFITLSLLEIVLGIDNLIFISLVVGHLDGKHRKPARFIGLGLAFGIRVIMLLGAKWIMGLTEPVISAYSFKDILLILGGLFLIIKSSMEIRSDLTGIKKDKNLKPIKGFTNAIAQIVFVDFIFSFDSIITAIGITTNIPIIVAAVAISMVVMLIASGYLSAFLDKYPNFEMLGIGFIVLVGIILLAEGFHQHIDREYIYFAFAFSITIEILNTLHNKKRHSR